MNEYKKIIIGFRPLIIAFLVLALGLAGCKKDGGGDTAAAGSSNDILLQAKIAQTTTTASEIDTLLGTQSVQASIKSSAKTRAANAVDLSTLKLYCVTFTSPPIPGEGDSDALGNISLLLVGAKDKPFGCFILDSSRAVLATLVIADPDEKSLDGTSSKSGSISFSGSVNLGNILLDIEKGIAVVDKSKITSSDGTSPPQISATSGELFDFTGTWTMTSIPDPPDGYIAMCTQDEAKACEAYSYGSRPSECDKCDGPSDGMSIYLKRLKGDKVNADGTKDTTTQVYGIMIWESSAAMNDCGKKLGFTEADPKTDIGIDFTSYQTEMDLTYGPFIFSDQATLKSGGTTIVQLTDGWKAKNDARAKWEMWDWYLDTDGTWRTISVEGTQILAQDGLCRDITIPTTPDLDKNFYAVQQLQCYANFYHEDLNVSGTCIKRIDIDWTAMDPANFLKDDNTSESLFVFEKFVYTGPSSGTFTQYEERNGGYRYTDGSNNEQYVDCRISSKFTMSITKVSDTELIGDFQDEKKMVDAKTECTNFVNINKTDVLEEYDMGSSSARYMVKMEKVVQ